jgi:hypothetical protein
MPVNDLSWELSAAVVSLLFWQQGLWMCLACDPGFREAADLPVSGCSCGLEAAWVLLSSHTGSGKCFQPCFPLSCLVWPLILFPVVLWSLPDSHQLSVFSSPVKWPLRSMLVIFLWCPQIHWQHGFQVEKLSLLPDEAHLAEQCGAIEFSLPSAVPKRHKATWPEVGRCTKT